MSASTIAAGSSFTANLVCLALAIQIPPQVGWIGTGAAFYSIGAVLGILHGLVLARASVLSVALGALAAALILCVPVVLITYGFALLGAPLVLAYVLLVGVGTYIGARRRERHATA